MCRLRSVIIRIVTFAIGSSVVLLLDNWHAVTQQSEELGQVVTVTDLGGPNSNEITVDEDPLRFSIETEPAGTQISDLFVFVGEKLEVVDVIPPHGEEWFDAVFDAKYRIIEKVSGEFNGNIIKFRAFDHYGFPPFAKYKYALLFVSKHENELYHEKYQFFDVNQTMKGEWASCGDPYRRDDYHRKSFVPKDLEFPNPVTFDLTKLNAKQIDEIYPVPYFEIIGKKAVCRKGAFVDDLFQIKKNGVLKARGVGQ